MAQQPNPLDAMNWQERFHQAFLALLAMERRAIEAEEWLAKHQKPISFRVDRRDALQRYASSWLDQRSGS